MSYDAHNQASYKLYIGSDEDYCARLGIRNTWGNLRLYHCY